MGGRGSGGRSVVSKSSNRSISGILYGIKKILINPILKRKKKCITSVNRSFSLSGTELTWSRNAFSESTGSMFLVKFNNMYACIYLSRLIYVRKGVKKSSSLRFIDSKLNGTYKKILSLLS